MNGCSRVYDRTDISTLVHNSSSRGCNAALLGEWFPVLRRNIQSSSWRVMMSTENTKVGSVAGIYIDEVWSVSGWTEEWASQQAGVGVAWLYTQMRPQKDCKWMCTGGLTSAADQVGSYWFQSSGMGKGRGRIENNHCTISPPQHLQLQPFQDLFYIHTSLLLHLQIGLPALPPATNWSDLHTSHMLLK